MEEQKASRLAVLCVLRVGGGDGFVDALREGVGIARGEAGGRDGVADDDEDRAGVEVIDVDGEELVGADEREGNERNLSLDGHEGASGHHGLKLAGGGAAAFRKEHEREAVL